MSASPDIDTLIDARWVIPVEPARTVLPEHSVAVKGGRIVDILPTTDAHIRYRPERHHRLEQHALIPGLINLHTHAAMTLLRGLADDLPLMEWLRNHIWPAENRHLSGDFVRDGTLLACAEMLRRGITCFNDMYFFPAAAAEAALAAGMRAAIGLIVIEFPTPYASDAEDYLAKGLAVRDQFRHETLDEIRQSLADHRLRPLQRLRNLGLLGPNLIAVHAVHLLQEEIAVLAQQGCHLAHCPTSNLKLASGISPVAGLLQGVNIGLGTDGAASNNRLDLFGEMRLAALLAKGASGAADTLPAHQALRMATLNGAKALGLDAELGSLAAGKKADIAAVNLAALETTPCYDVVSQLVYAAGREHVTHVWVDGELRLEDRTLTLLDSRELSARAASWRERISRPGA